MSHLSRREFTRIGLQAAATVTAWRFVVSEAVAQSGTRYRRAFRPLDGFIEQYLRDMNTPGMTLVLADQDQVQRVATYGFSDIERKVAPAPEDLFQIGSISKSMVAICLLQLHEEGKLDLNKPVTEYLPWFRIESSFAPVTTHHLLTHTSGLPSMVQAFFSDPAGKHRAANAPGQYFHYCNMGFTVLGYLLWTLDGREIGDAIRKRIFEPLGMTQSEPVITLDARARFARNYAAFQNDRPYARHGRLAEAPAIILTLGAGCVASTPRDMGYYVQMLANHGRGQRERLMSEESFALFSHPHIAAEDFGPTSSYGYGIVVDTLDGHAVLRHTGGMVSFASTLQVDIESGVGAFASINAMQGYRPNPVVQYAISLMRAQRAGKALPAAPASRSPTTVEHAKDYAGTYQRSDGRTLVVVAEGQKIFLEHHGARVPLETAIEPADAFAVLHPDYARFLLVFGRADEKDPHSAVVEAGWGSDWFSNAKYSGPKQFESPKLWESYVGHYRNENPWVGSSRVVLRKGKLMLDGVVPLEAAEDGVFYLRDEAHSPEWVSFADIVNGMAMRMKMSGEDLWRVMAE